MSKPPAEKIADEIEYAAIGSVGEDEDTGGATMVPRKKLLRWRDELQSVSEEHQRTAEKYQVLQKNYIRMLERESGRDE